MAEDGFQHHFAAENKGRLEDLYTVDKAKLGEGSYGSVFKAKNKATEAIRAVKNISLKAFKDKDMKRFQAEVNIMKMIDHPNVVKLYESFKDAKCVYLVMELCEGGELFDRIVDEGGEGFTEHKAATYMSHIMAAMQYMHKHQIAHRDIKPENFLLQDKSADAEIKVIDFGLAMQYTPGKPMTTKAGTPYYVAPDVLQGKYDHKCDIWSCGVIAYILLCGYPPFYGDDDKEILKKVRSGKFDFPSPDWDQIGADAKDMIEKMLILDPAKRPEATDILESKWIKKEMGEHSTIPLQAGAIAKLQNFNKMRKLKKICVTMIATQLKEKDIEDLKEVFKGLDVNQDGTLSHAEFKKGLAKSNLSPEEVEALISRLDTDMSGEIDYSEFVACTLDKSKYNKQEILWSAFRSFDLDHDGKITSQELSTILNGDDHKLDADKIEAAKKMIQECDTNGDGVIDFEEFCTMMAD